MWFCNEYQKLPDVIVFGHTHQALLEKQQSAIKINIGSPTFPQYQQQPGMVRLLTIKSVKAKTQIIQLS
ncbi:metallophosphoesterase family protein [Chloroflexota bacterium]